MSFEIPDNHPHELGRLGVNSSPVAKDGRRPLAGGHESQRPHGVRNSKLKTQNSKLTSASYRRSGGPEGSRKVGCGFEHGLVNVGGRIALDETTETARIADDPC